MQTQNHASALCATSTTSPAPSHQQDRISVQSAASSLHLLTLDPAQPRAPTSSAPLDSRAGRAMNILAPPLASAHSLAPFGRRPEPGSSLGTKPSPFSPRRSEHRGYPSPPMSDSHSPNRRSAQLVEPDGHRYGSASDARRTDGLSLPPPSSLPPPPPPPALPAMDPRSVTSPQGMVPPRSLYPGEGQLSGHPFHYQAGRVPDHGGFNGGQVPHSYAMAYPGSAATYLPSPGLGYPAQQQPALISAHHSRPNKPARRTKTHVASACVNCKKAHLSCDVARPCGRCVASGKQETCKDVQHKKRGRPRLRDDKDFSRGEEGRSLSSQILPPPPPGTETFPLQPQFPSSHQATNPLRVLNRAGQGSNEFSPISTQSPVHQRGGPPTSGGNYGAVSSSPYSSGARQGYEVSAVAFLDLDLVVKRSNSAFESLVAGGVQGRNLSELIDPQQGEVLQRLRNEMREERDAREPSYMPPITSEGPDPIQAVSERDVEEVSKGFTDRRPSLALRSHNGQYQPFQTQIRLAKTSLYFVTLVIHSIPRSTAPPLLTSQLAPPTPIHASQTLSAPTAPPSRDFGPYPRPPSSASSAPASPYYSFPPRNSLHSTTAPYGNSPSYSYSPTTGSEQGYFPTIQPLPQPSTYPSPYGPVSRRESAVSEYGRRPEIPHDGNRPSGRQGFQLPPILTEPYPPRGSELSESANERVRRREASPGPTENTESPDTAKRRKLNIEAMLQ